MAHSPHTGKSMTISFGAGLTAFPGVTRIVISERAAPLPEELDNTKAGDSTYSTMPDPLGGKGAPLTSITISGLASLSDYGDSGIFAETLNATEDTVVMPTGNTATNNKFSATQMELVGVTRTDDIRERAVYTATLELEGTGAWEAI